MKKLESQGQTATEFLILLTVVFVGFVGVVPFFSNQVNDWLSTLWRLIQLPF